MEQKSNESDFLFLPGSCYRDILLQFLSLFGFCFFNFIDLHKQLLPVYNHGYEQKQRETEISKWFPLCTDGWFRYSTESAGVDPLQYIQNWNSKGKTRNVLVKEALHFSLSYVEVWKVKDSEIFNKFKIKSRP